MIIEVKSPFPQLGRERHAKRVRQNRDARTVEEGEKRQTDGERETERQRGKASVWRGFMSGACLLAMGLVPLWSTPL